MLYNPRILEISTLKQAFKELKKINCDINGLKIMAPKALFKIVKLENITVKSANLLKQTFLAKGGECAVSRCVATQHENEYTDVLIFASIKQYHLALKQLKQQPWGLPEIAGVLDSVLKSNDNFPERNYVWKNSKLKIKKNKTLIMGVINLTPDSFSECKQIKNIDEALKKVQTMIKDGADIIDIGAESTRPYDNPKKISADEELNRLIPVLKKILDFFKVPISIDTYKAVVAEEALKLGANIINDIWGLQYDHDMAKVVAKYNVPVIIMHNQSKISNNSNIMSNICCFLNNSIKIAHNVGINSKNIIIDPGIGFGKTSVDNLMIMTHLHELKVFNCPILLGTSRKRFIGEILNLPVNDRVEGTSATVALGISKGVNIIRVHDVKVMARIAKMTDSIMKYNN